MTLVKKLGEGSEGEALLYQDELINYTVAKIIPIKNILEIKPVISEFELMRKLSSPSFPRYYSLKRTASEMILTMEYIEGPTLR